MSEFANTNELNERLDLIQSMIAEGRRKAESWGWTFVLWGVAYFVAFFWASWGHFYYAWPVTVITAGLITSVGFMRKKSAPNTTMARAIGSIWMATGLSMFIVFDALGFSRHMTDVHVFLATAAAFLGLANMACGLILQWKAEIACAIVWWAAAIAVCFTAENVAIGAFLLAVFLCQIVFGFYAMIRESRSRQQLEAHHG